MTLLMDRLIRTLVSHYAEVFTVETDNSLIRLGLSLIGLFHYWTHISRALEYVYQFGIES
jgi:hypothetical protein